MRAWKEQQRNRLKLAYMSLHADGLFQQQLVERSKVPESFQQHEREVRGVPLLFAHRMQPANAQRVQYQPETMDDVEDRSEDPDDMDGGAASRKRGALSTSSGSGRKRAKCEHGRERSKCKECGGGSICPHGRQKPQCKECGGSNICAHGRIKQQCKACGGSAICPHGRIKSTCKECGGSRICPHGRIKRQCKECGGSGICLHGRRKQQCKECGGSNICPQGRQKQTCRECGGSSICAHGRIKYGCKACLQSSESTSKPQSSLTASSAPSVERDHALGKDTQLIELLGVADALELV